MSAPGAPEEQPLDATRRRALKLGTAAGAAALVWTEPTVRGLATRPAYANAGSAVSYSTAAVTLGGVTGPSTAFSPTMVTGPSVTVTLTEGFFGSSWTMTAAVPPAPPDEPGCACTITGTGSITLDDDAGNGPIAGAVQPDGSVLFAPTDSLSGALTLSAPSGLTGVCGP